MKFISLILAVLMIFLLGQLSVVSSGQLKTAPAQVTGRINDIMGALIANAQITVEGDHTVYTGVSGEEGQYAISIPEGLYRIKIASQGFCPTRRGTFKIGSGETARFDFMLLVCPIANMINLKTGEEKDVLEAPFKEDTYQIPSGSNASFDLMIQYGEHTQEKNKVEYRGYKNKFTYDIEGSRHNEEKWVQVVVSYNLLTIKADKVSYDKNDFSLRAAGNVAAENGLQHIEADRIDLIIKNGIAKIKAN